MRVSALYRYPVKSLNGLSLPSAQLDDFGIVQDRRFMLIDDSNQFITQRQYPRLSLLTLSFNESSLYDISLGSESLCRFSEVDCTDSIATEIWGEQAQALVAEDSLTTSLSEYLGLSVRLAYMPESTFRQVDRNFVEPIRRTSFTDGFPFLILTESSIADLNVRLEDPVSAINFRPNILISGAEAYAEDEWRRIQIGEVIFDVVKPCSRCIMTTVGTSGEKHREPLRTLSTYRKNEFGVCFGQNAVHQSQEPISVGDSVNILA